MANLNYGIDCVYSIQYHIAWCKYKALTKETESKLIEILNQIAEDNNFKIIDMNGDLDHIHLLIECSPQHYIPDIIKSLKGISEIILKSESNEKSLWYPSYFVATTSKIIEEQIKNYIKCTINRKDEAPKKSQIDMPMNFSQTELDDIANSLRDMF